MDFFSDTQIVKDEYAVFMKENHLEVMENDSMYTGVKGELTDFFLMSMARAIVVSTPGTPGKQTGYTDGGWTSFSWAASRINNLNLITTYPHIDSPDFRYARYTKINGGKRVENIFYFNEVDEFVQSISSSRVTS